MRTWCENTEINVEYISIARTKQTITPHRGWDKIIYSQIDLFCIWTTLSIANEML